MIMIDWMSVLFGMAAPPFMQIVVGYRDGAGRCKALVAAILRNLWTLGYCPKTPVLVSSEVTKKQTQKMRAELCRII